MKKYYVVEFDEDTGLPNICINNTYLVYVRRPGAIVNRLEARLGDRLLSCTIRKATFGEVLRLRNRAIKRITRIA